MKSGLTPISAFFGEILIGGIYGDHSEIVLDMKDDNVENLKLTLSKLWK